MKKGKFILTLEKSSDGTVSFSHSIENMSYFEVIGLLQIHQHDLIELSRKRADEIKSSSVKTSDDK